MNSRFATLLLVGVCASLMFSIRAEEVSATIQTPPPAESGYFKLGSNKNPAGHEIGVNSRSLLFDGQPVFPVMGEMHYARVPQAEWRDELLKMKAGGVDIVATYVFWIHHEEIEGKWDWSGQRDLKKFLQTCNELGLKVIVRCGPWCHGEVRNGGFPDWMVAHKDWKLRSTDTNFLAATKILYGEISKQLQGELWKVGGPVIGIQVDNEFGGSPNYLMALKKLAIEAGLDVPLYIKTGWPAMRSPVPLGELLPLFGAYPDGFWSRSIKPMDGDDWENFTFKITRTDAGIGNDTLKKNQDGDTAGTEKYPHLTCEVGGGMPASYHRRINYDPRDVEAVVLTQLGGGSSLLGYYMYHGGQNPDGKLTTLNESQATGYPNDLPVKSYDFNAPIGEYGQLNPQYHWLRRLHLFVHDFGSGLASMPATLPDQQPKNKADLSTLRWAVRSDGNQGYVFINNYQRLQPLPAKPVMQFHLRLPGGDLLFPDRPVTIPADTFFFWPFNFDLGGARLVYATAQPVCKIDDGNIRTIFFAEITGVPAEFALAGEAGDPEPVRVWHLSPAKTPGCKIKTANGREIHIVLLNEADSLALWKGRFAGSEKVFLTHSDVTFDGDDAMLTSENPEKLKVEVCPPLPDWAGHGDGVFQRLTLPRMRPALLSAWVSQIQPTGEARKIPLSPGKAHLPLAPDSLDFTHAGIWKIQLPAALDLSLNPVLRIHYTGDVARMTLNGRLLDDNFYNGREFDLGLKRYAPEILGGDLWLQVLPLSSDSPVFIEDRARPDFDGEQNLGRFQSVEIINHYRIILRPTP